MTLFTCLERVSAGRFTIPKDILASLLPSTVTPGPISVPTGQLILVNYRFPAKFEAHRQHRLLLVADTPCQLSVECNEFARQR